MTREYWVNVFTDDDRCIRHASREDALDELIERAEDGGLDRVPDTYWTTTHVYELRGNHKETGSVNLKDDADEELDRRDREACVAKYAPNLVE